MTNHQALNDFPHVHREHIFKKYILNFIQDFTHGRLNEFPIDGVILLSAWEYVHEVTA